MRMIIHVFLAALAFVLSVCPVHADQEAKPLFRTNDTVKLEISAPWRALRREDEEKAWPATVSWVDAQGQNQSRDITVERRGISRQRVCEFPPIRIRFGKRVKDDGLFEGQKSLKMVTHCDDNERYQQYYILEMLAYRVYNLITDYSFRVRPLEVTYRDVDSDRTPEPVFAFLIEDDKDVARRKGLEKLDIANTAPDRLDSLEASRLALFQMMIGNLDWSPITGPDEKCCHNTKLIGQDPRADPVIAIPYDFDSTGLVDPPYAVPPESLPVRSLKQRLFRGYCANNSTLQQVRDELLQLRPAIESLFVDEGRLTSRYRKKALKFLEPFFETLADDRDFRKDIVEECRG